MIKIITLISLLLCGQVIGQTNATNVTVTDCAGVSHNLFSELDAGKIIVIGWTMPCATCAGPLLGVHNSVLNYYFTNPGVVEYWLTDDFANTSCATVEGWSNANGITNAIYFSSSELNMYDYGSAGMPKVVVLGCADHKVFYNQNDTPNEHDATIAIDAALADIASGCTDLGLNEEASLFGLLCYPNPANSVLNVAFTSLPSINSLLEVYSINGTLLKSIPLLQLSSSQEFQVNISEFVDGIYLLKINDGNKAEIE